MMDEVAEAHRAHAQAIVMQVALTPRLAAGLLRKKYGSASGKQVADMIALNPRGVPGIAWEVMPAFLTDPRFADTPLGSAYAIAEAINLLAALYEKIVLQGFGELAYPPAEYMEVAHE